MSIETSLDAMHDEVSFEGWTERAWQYLSEAKELNLDPKVVDAGIVLGTLWRAVYDPEGQPSATDDSKEAIVNAYEKAVLDCDGFAQVLVEIEKIKAERSEIPFTEIYEAAAEVFCMSFDVERERGVREIMGLPRLRARLYSINGGRLGRGPNSQGPSRHPSVAFELLSSQEHQQLEPPLS